MTHETSHRRERGAKWNLSGITRALSTASPVEEEIVGTVRRFVGG